MKKTIKIIGKVITWLLFLFIWLVYAYSTLDRSSGEPMPGGYSLVVLPILLAVLMRKGVFNKKLSGYNLFSKIIVLVLLVLGFLLHSVG